MRFVDRVRVLVRGGDGGDGCVAWRREAHTPRGGPAGGNGGQGGSVWLEADAALSTLLDLRYRQHYAAAVGRAGQGKQMNGRAGEDLVIRVPVGTFVVHEGEPLPDGRPPWKAGAPDEGPENVWVIELEPEEGDPAELFGAPPPVPPAHAATAGTLLADLREAGQRVLVARGGRGGHGNRHFRSSTNRAPETAEAGEPGEARWLRLDLKLLADVGIVGFPNVGKSTFIRAISQATPRVGAYPFTTLVPQLGVASLPGDVAGRTMVVADVPGLVRGASRGRGLGHAFLRHLERTRVLLHLLAPDPGPDREPLADLDALEAELAAYGPMFAGRPRVVALNKIDTPEGAGLLQDLRRQLAERDTPLFPICARTGEGVPALLEALWRRLARGAVPAP
jgi:GTP-binding protein